MTFQAFSARISSYRRKAPNRYCYVFRNRVDVVKLCISNRSITIFFVMENKSFFTFKDRVLYPSNLKKNHLTLVLQTKDLINTGSFSKLDSLPLIPKGTGVEGAF